MKRIKKFIAVVLAMVMILQLSYVDMTADTAKAASANVYIKSANDNTYLYASDNTVKAGDLSEGNFNYVWSLEEVTWEGVTCYSIKNLGTGTYMCLEKSTGNVDLMTTVYNNWMSSKWYVSESGLTCTIDNVWKSTRNAGAGGFISLSGNQAIYGENVQSWVMEEFSLDIGIDDGNPGKLNTNNNKTAADAIAIPGADTNLNSVGATMPYTRYDSTEASLGGNASIVTSPNHSQDNIASQASDQSYVTLPSSGSYAEWTMNTSGNGVTMRFTMPDSSDGMGQNGSLDVYVNGRKVKTVDLTSYYMWQYFKEGKSSDTPSGVANFAFDEVHFLLDNSLRKGDKIRIQSSGANGLVYGVDFLEIEEVYNPIPQPEGSYSVTDFGAIPNDGQDDYTAILAAVSAADAAGKDIYFPAGTYHINQIWRMYGEDIMVTGAGMWYTNIQFTNDQPEMGGVSGGIQTAGSLDGYCRNVEFCNMYINSNL